MAHKADQQTMSRQAAAGALVMTPRMNDASLEVGPQEKDPDALRRAKPIIPSLSEERETYISCEMERKRNLQDSILLANRIALLQGEEMKAAKKIKETQDFARKMIESRKRKEDEQRKAQEEQAKRVATQKMLAERARQQREEMKRKIYEKKHALASQKTAIRREMRQTREENQQQAKYQDSGLDKRRAEQREKVLNSRVRAREQRELKRAEIIERSKEHFQERFEMSEMSVEYQLEIKERMVIEELALIDRLQATQQIQRQAYDDYERLLYGEHVDENSVILRADIPIAAAVDQLRGGF